MKNYSKEVISSIQDVINSGNYEIKNIQTSDEMPSTIYANGAKITLFPADSNGHYSTIMKLDYSFNDRDLVEWKKEPLGKFYGKDWRLINKGLEHYKLYSILKVNINKVDIELLIRNIDPCEFDAEEMYDYCADLIIDENAYSIIKAFSPSIYETYASKSMLEEKNFKINYLSTYGVPYIDVVEDENIEETLADNQTSIELF